MDVFDLLLVDVETGVNFFDIVDLDKDDGTFRQTNHEVPLHLIAIITPSDQHPVVIQFLS